MKKFLKCCPKLILFYFTDPQTKEKVLATLFKVITQFWCCNARQCSTNTKMMHPDFFLFFFFVVKIVVGIFITRNWWLDVVASIKILAIRLVNDPLDLFPFYHDLHIAYRQHLPMQRLQNAVPPKQHWNSELRAPMTCAYLTVMLWTWFLIKGTTGIY